MSFLLIIIGAFVASLLLCMVRAVLGATMFDRVVSIDAVTSISIAVLALLALYFEETIFLDVAIVYALVSFLGDLAAAKYLEGRGLEE